MSIPTRFTITVELSPKEGETPQHAAEFIQWTLDFYHPRLQAKVSPKVEIHAAEPEPPKVDLSLL